MTNFEFLKGEWTDLYRQMQLAERRVYTEPTSTAAYCRLVLESCVYEIYDREDLEVPYNKQLDSLLRHRFIEETIPFHLQNGLSIVRKTGNNSVHYGKNVTSKEALRSLKYLYPFIKWFVGFYGEEEVDLPGAFMEHFIPTQNPEERQAQQVKAERNKIKAEMQAEHQKAEADWQTQIAALKAENAQKDAVLAEIKATKDKEALAAHKAKEARNAAAKEAIRKKRYARLEKIKDIPSEYSEAETRLHLIEVDLKEAGWANLQKGRDTEYHVTGMPITADNPKGNGYADYVLWDDNGKPLAVIEAKRTKKDEEAGRHQAYLYANCLEQMHGQRPIIFYTNGYETKVWEDRFYSAPRRIYGFYSKDTLQWRIQQGTTRKDIRKAVVNEEIAGRPYQMEAIQRVSESFVVNGKTGGKKEELKGDRRNVLLVMATGSGKTRTSAALVEVLMKHNWAKRVLFLADRNALVRQAKSNYNDYLPNLSAINLTEEKENDTTRLVFSTYPSMLNRIDDIATTGKRLYGVGHFDLIIVDEAHRSVYNRYKAIFDYFDALIVGLTATPKDSIDHNTFELFGCSDADPTFEYNLEEAVPTFLKTYKNLDVSTDFLREGIQYKDLSEAEKETYEETFRDTTTGIFPEEIEANAMNKWLFNKDTVYKVLDAFMENGLKIEGGDKIGRTIIFAVNQKHADFIVACFEERYPDHPSNFIQSIHNKVSHAQSSIEAFCNNYKENLPQIAVSVDMMDTGVDAPRVLNLIFFKVVRSPAKFWQMIGRGTRLCPDVFGPDQPKEYFLIFDVCQNFEFFDQTKNKKEGKAAKPITQQTFEARLQLSRLLTETGETENLALAKALLDRLHQATAELSPQDFRVKMHARYVDEFKERSRWNNLSNDDVDDIEQHIAALPQPEAVKEEVRYFDLMMLKLQIANLLPTGSEGRFHNNLMNIAEGLSKKYSVPDVLKAKKRIESLKDPDFYKTLTQSKIEAIRTEIRDLMKYLDKNSKVPIYTNIQDSEIVLTEGKPLATYSNETYRKRVERFIEENKHQLTISKLSTNQPITYQELQLLEEILFDGEERGTKADFDQYAQLSLSKFVREIVGLDVASAQQAFAEFLQKSNTLTANQMNFLNTIIKHLTQNGMIEPKMLFESPFTDTNDQGLLGVFEDNDATKIIHIIREINGNAEVA